MDYKLNREALTSAEVIFDGCQEQPIDLDFSLPDYCPDIQRILKCQVYPSISNRNLMGDRLEVEGSATVRVLYLDANSNCIRCCENTHAFSTSIALRQPADNAIAFAKTRVEYINCRATSPRRLDIHGAFSVCAKVLQQAENDYVCGIEGDDIQQRKKVLPASKVAGFSQQQFSISEVLEISDGKPPAETIIRSGLTATVQDFKIVANKLIVKGEASLRLLYSPGIDSSEPEAMEYLIPYSQMLDCNGVTEECTCEISMDVMNFDVDVKSDSSGENTLLELEAKMMASVVAYEDSEVTVVTDAYSTQFELSMDYKTKSMDTLMGIITDAVTQKSNFDLGDAGISKVIDIWNEISTVGAELENSQIIYKGKMNVCLLAVNIEGNPFYLERMVDFSCAHDWTKRGSQIRCDANVQVVNISYRITGATSIEVKSELKLTTSVYQQNSFKVLTDVTGDEDRPKMKDVSAALTIYYADAGESIWDIARNYCTSVDAIKAENDLTEETIEDRGMLLIPM